MVTFVLQWSFLNARSFIDNYKWIKSTYSLFVDIQLLFYTLCWITTCGQLCGCHHESLPRACPQLFLASPLPSPAHAPELGQPTATRPLHLSLPKPFLPHDVIFAPPCLECPSPRTAWSWFVLVSCSKKLPDLREMSILLPVPAPPLAFTPFILFTSAYSEMVLLLMCFLLLLLTMSSWEQGFSFKPLCTWHICPLVWARYLWGCKQAWALTWGLENVVSG